MTIQDVYRLLFAAISIFHEKVYYIILRAYVQSIILFRLSFCPALNTLPIYLSPTTSVDFWSLFLKFSWVIAFSLFPTFCEKEKENLDFKCSQTLSVFNGQLISAGFLFSQTWSTQPRTDQRHQHPWTACWTLPGQYCSTSGALVCLQLIWLTSIHFGHLRHFSHTLCSEHYPPSFCHVALHTGSHPNGIIYFCSPHGLLLISPSVMKPLLIEDLQQVMQSWNDAFLCDFWFIYHFTDSM